MKPIFVDTAGWMMMFDAADPQHDAARETRDRWLARGGRLVSSTFVLDETLTLMRVRLGRESARNWWSIVSASQRLVWFDVDADCRKDALKWFFKLEDRRLSFTDCTSFALMKKHGVKVAFTSDRHFRQARFGVVPD
ncbi:MAG: type II toxin-antitoxin system VapC family toxin [Deltaproteobacteria bacterium]|nr:type II toxin-antitoxin system VapC family toxin [Deltaproteobacteria bacterium]